MYSVMYSSQDDGENGLYLNNTLVASAWLLRKLGHDVYRIANWSQANLARIARQAEWWLRS